MIEVRSLTKQYGTVSAVDDMDLTARPGVVTGFLGPNGAGKSTTMRIVAGLTHATSGAALVDGRRFAEHTEPLHVMGVMLDGRALHPGRSGRDHLRALAATHGIARKRVDDVIDLVGMGAVASHRARTYSTGMSQRIALAAALLGDPQTLMLDEPANGLDPAGIRWMRDLLRSLAAEGRTIFVSSHQMNEVALTADQVVVIRNGRVLADQPVSELTDALVDAVRVRTPAREQLAALLGDDATPDPDDTELLTLRGRSAEDIARAALAHGIPVYELTPVHPTLEDAYLRLTEATP